MATKKAKPNGQFYLELTDVNEYFKKIEISELPGQCFVYLQISICI